MGILGCALMRAKQKSILDGPQRVGYARVSTKDQNLSRQLRALKKARCSLIFQDKASGKSLAGRPQLQRALEALAPDDCLIVAEWDRATRSMWDGLQIIQHVVDAGASIQVLDRSYIDLDTPMGRGLVAFLSAMAEDERNRILERTRQGRQAAVARGVRMGAKPKLNEEQRERARKRMAAGETPGEIAKDFRVHRTTIARLR